MLFLFWDSYTRTCCLFLMPIVFREDFSLNVKLCFPVWVKGLLHVFSFEVPASLSMPVCTPSGSHMRNWMVKIAFSDHLCTENLKFAMNSIWRLSNTTLILPSFCLLFSYPSYFLNNSSVTSRAHRPQGIHGVCMLKSVLVHVCHLDSINLHQLEFIWELRKGVCPKNRIQTPRKGKGSMTDFLHFQPIL